MKNRIYIYAILLMTIAATMAPKAMCQTELYKQYKHLTDVKVVCIMKFPINDTTTTSLTLFVPKTKEAVYYLAEEFNLGIEKDIIDEGLGNKGNISLFRKLVHKDDPTKSYGVVSGDDDLKDVSMLVYNVNIGTVLIFQDIETMERIKVISDFLTTALTKPERLKNIEQIIK
jgi:hypothetical protein